METIRGLLPSS
uniref:Uncharacterized protein n=1 Tax=Anguilla anguilla TaxID=7936 RepID=A0A0E9TP65_ANGAN